MSKYERNNWMFRSIDEDAYQPRTKAYLRVDGLPSVLVYQKPIPTSDCIVHQMFYGTYLWEEAKSDSNPLNTPEEQTSHIQFTEEEEVECSVRREDKPLIARGLLSTGIQLSLLYFSINAAQENKKEHHAYSLIEIEVPFNSNKLDPTDILFIDEDDIKSIRHLDGTLFQPFKKLQLASKKTMGTPRQSPDDDLQPLSFTL